MNPNPDQLAKIHSGMILASNPARYEDPQGVEVKPSQPTVIIGPNAVYLNVPGHWDQKLGEVPPTEPPPVEEAGPPVLSALEPAQLSVGAPDTTVLVKGSGFTAESVIIWNGGEEVTNFGDAETLSTLVKPSTVSPDLPLPFSLPVKVKTGALESSELQFSFVA